jgi:hypothetical protein
MQAIEIDLYEERQDGRRPACQAFFEICFNPCKKGGYTGREEQILYTVISFRELPQLKRLVHGIDPDAFVVVTDTLEVMGHRIGNQPRW